MCDVLGYSGCSSFSLAASYMAGSSVEGWQLWEQTLVSLLGLVRLGAPCSD